MKAKAVASPSASSSQPAEKSRTRKGASIVMSTVAAAMMAKEMVNSRLTNS